MAFYNLVRNAFRELRIGDKYIRIKYAEAGIINKIN